MTILLRVNINAILFDRKDPKKKRRLIKTHAILMYFNIM